MRTNLTIFFLAVNAFAASPIIVGGRGGTALSVTNSSSSFGRVTNEALGHNYAIGPTLGVRLPLNFSVEGDALYNRRSFGYGLSGIGDLAGLNTHTDWWEFPVMLKFSGGNGPIAPVLGAGVTAQHISNFGSVPQFLQTGRTNANSFGFVAGGGVQFRVGSLRVTPELRYTRWTSGTWSQDLLDTVLSQVVGGRNQAQFLVGFTF